MKVLLVALLLSLAAGCAEKKWTYSEVLSKSSQFDSTFLRYQPENETIGVGVELLKGSFGTYGYLQVSARKIPALPGSPDQSIVVFLIEEEKFPYKANRMDGGQKLLLPEEATEKLIHSLQDGLPVTICLDGYMSKLEPSNFPKLSKKFYK